jgi:hypothetical protein
MTAQIDGAGESQALATKRRRCRDYAKVIRGLFKRKQRKVRLICMRLDNIVKAHPKQLTDQCSECGYVIGIPPSGMRVIAAAKYPGQVEIICQRCNTAGFGKLTSRAK